MREIKFRAWDKGEELMHIAPVVQPNDFVGVPVISNDGWELEKRKWADVIVMQYTGLKDKNGKEIYEGDILCVLEDVVADTIDGFNRYEQEGDFMEVVFDQYGRWSIKGNNMVNGELLHDMLSDAEIIGNIYENPELLTQ